MTEHTCCECGGTNELLLVSVWWQAWGHNCFDFHWSKNTTPGWICEKCDEGWTSCDKCGALIDGVHYGTGYLSEDEMEKMEERLCPECAKKQGYEIQVEIGPPPVRVTGAAG